MTYVSLFNVVFNCHLLISRQAVMYTYQKWSKFSCHLFSSSQSEITNFQNILECLIFKYKFWTLQDLIRTEGVTFYLLQLVLPNRILPNEWNNAHGYLIFYKVLRYVFKPSKWWFGSIDILSEDSYP